METKFKNEKDLLAADFKALENQQAYQLQVLQMIKREYDNLQNQYNHIVLYFFIYFIFIFNLGMNRWIYFQRDLFKLINKLPSGKKNWRLNQFSRNAICIYLNKK